MGVDKDTNTMTKNILDLALEIIFLLTGEDYTVVKKASGEHLATNSCPLFSWEWTPTVEPPLHSLISERRKVQKILDLSNKIIELLTGEVPIRCQDVTVYFSMEEWEYLEEHKALYDDFFMEDYQRCTSVADGCRKNMEGYLLSSSNFECKTTSINQDALGKKCISQNICPQLYSRLLPSDPPKEKQSSSDHSQIVTQSTNYIEGKIFPSPENRCGEFSQPSCNGESQLSENIECFAQKNKNVNLFLCTECGKCFAQKSAVIEYGGIDSEEKPYSCLACGKRFTKKTGLVEHQRTHTGERLFQCSECGKRFSRKSLLIRHYRSHTGERVFQCSDCGKCFVYKSDLFKHQKRHTGEKPFSCSECGKCFYQKSDLVRHQKVHTEEKLYSCNKIGIVFTKETDLENQTDTGEDPFSCPECEKCFSKKSEFNRHWRIHTGAKTFPCSECGKCFFNKSDLIRHQKTHTGERSFSCQECGKCYIHKTGLVEHLRTHTGENLFPCSECGKCFTNKSALVRHLKVHTGEKPFACSECGKCFSHKSGLLDHQRIHTGEKPFLCSECGKCYSTRSDLTRHQKIHRGEKLLT